MITAQEWMTHEVLACRPDSDLAEAARLMWERDCGALPVVDGAGKLVGMVTDRDLAMAGFFRGQPLRAVHVGACMSSQPHACAPTDPIERVIRVMADHQVRRVPIVDVGGEVRGILSQSDLLRRALSGLDELTAQFATTAGVEAGFSHLLRLRVSQLNQCAFCVRLHARDALRHGETPDRVALLTAWRDTDY